MAEPNQPTYNRTSNRYQAGEQDVNAVLQVRTRFSAAQVNAGATLLAAAPQGAYRLISLMLIAIGGAAAGATAVVILGTRSAGAVTLVSVAVAGLTQSTPVPMSAAAAVLLADGASHTALDANTAITIGKTGASLTGATSVDVIAMYAID